MAFRHPKSGLAARTKYLQVALNGTLDDARDIIAKLPANPRILVETGTPLIKRYGEEGIRQVRAWWGARLGGITSVSMAFEGVELAGYVVRKLREAQAAKNAPVPAAEDVPGPYIVADLKTIDRGATEVELAARAGASAAVAMGSAPTETLNSFITACQKNGVDAFIDMMNVANPVQVLRALKLLPRVTMLHRGVDEERDNKEKQLPLHEIRRIKSAFDMLIAVAGGDTLREVQSAAFNDADIVVVWKEFCQSSGETVSLAESFLKEVR